MRMRFARIIHEYNNACTKDVPREKVCPDCARLARNLLIWLSGVVTAMSFDRE